MPFISDLSTTSAFWILFGVLFAGMFWIDLYASTHRTKAPTFRTGIVWSAIWIAVSLVFATMIFFFMENGYEKALEFLAAYLMEKSLSVDNLFVFLMVFSAFRIPLIRQASILKWGIIGAIIMRIIFLGLGITIIEWFHTALYFFGILLIYTAYSMVREKEEKPLSIQDHWLVRFISKHFPILTEYSGTHFFERVKGIMHITPLFLCLLVIETTDLLFAVDSIPAVIALSQDFFIVLTSNLFAILGLRSLYYILADLADMFAYLKYGVAVILAFVGTKMLLSDVYHIPTAVSLSVILVCLIIAIIVSILHRPKTPTPPSDGIQNT